MRFINKTENPPSTIVVRTQSQSKENYETNGHDLKFIVKSILYYSRQCIDFRTTNQGNVDGKQVILLHFLKFPENTTKYYKRVCSPALRNVSYLFLDS